MPERMEPRLSVFIVLKVFYHLLLVFLSGCDDRDILFLGASACSFVLNLLCYFSFGLFRFCF